MKVVILAGGFGTRIGEETHLRPKPMIEIGDRPILLHIMNIYSYYGFHEFIICLGYKGNLIKQYFSDYYLFNSDVTFDFGKQNQMTIHNHFAEPWKVTLVDTGIDTMTGGRVKRIQKFIGNEPFMLTYGDGVSDIDIRALLEYHQKHGRLATVTATQPIGRFGALDIISDNNLVSRFKEKPKGDGGWVNSGFFVCQPEVMDYIEGDHSILEKEPLENLSKDNELAAYKHDGFWHPMDTMWDKTYLEGLWKSGKAYWSKS
ncbi:glucose-1-phosphate cytidylyltransferase [Paenibacillus contaminans]|uniref:Glucose-1-phosphate cytidylyltransferase n=1 Tax=Paenibacillus contaminans TaxID=450362 RepID=A0A329LUB6_9BACL|nr:glucose-1-phosphate cytidylyltransferase [Paenibacillus contaminans]RAV10153.1 glucose-1-phosphate cytidylyltransferase [Paenibacillus contaminans]